MKLTVRRFQGPGLRNEEKVWTRNEPMVAWLQRDLVPTARWSHCL